MGSERRPLQELDGFWDEDIRHQVTVSGLPRYTHFRPGDYGGAHHIARQLARAAVEMSDEQQLSGRTSESYMSAVRSFARHLSEHPAPDRHSLTSDTPCLSEAVDEWEQHLAVRAPTATGPRKKVASLCRLLIYVDRDFLELGSTTRKRALAGSSLFARRQPPLLEYSNAERLLLRDAARKDVRELETRLEQGSRLLQQGRDPRRHGWTSVPNLLWLLARGELTLADFRENAQVSELQWPSCLRDGGDLPHPFPVSRAFRKLLTLLGPTQQDAVAFEILLLQDTVWAPEELHGLLISEMTETGGGRRYLKHKPRAQKVSYEELSNNSSPWSVNALVNRWTEATSTIRPLIRAGSPNHLLIVIRPQSNSQGWLVDRRQQAGYTMSEWIEDHQLTISQPHGMRRIRKTGKVIQALQAGTLAGAASNDHTVEVFAGHYLPMTTIHLLAPRVLSDATERVLAKATSTESVGPIVVPAPAAVVVDDAQYPTDIREAGDDELRSTVVDKQMLPVSCKSIADSPWAGPGTLCPERVRMCFSCPNAVVFEEHLPRVHSYLDRLEVLRAELPPPQFLDEYGQTYVNALAVLASFPDAVTEQARARATAEGINFPMNMRMNYGS